MINNRSFLNVKIMIASEKIHTYITPHTAPKVTKIECLDAGFVIKFLPSVWLWTSLEIKCFCKFIEVSCAQWSLNRETLIIFTIQLIHQDHILYASHSLRLIIHREDIRLTF